MDNDKELTPAERGARDGAEGVRNFPYKRGRKARAYFQAWCQAQRDLYDAYLASDSFARGTAFLTEYLAKSPVS